MRGSSRLQGERLLARDHGPDQAPGHGVHKWDVAADGHLKALPAELKSARPGMHAETIITRANRMVTSLPSCVCSVICLTHHPDCTRLSANKVPSCLPRPFATISDELSLLQGTWLECTMAQRWPRTWPSYTHTHTTRCLMGEFRSPLLTPPQELKSSMWLVSSPGGACGLSASGGFDRRQQSPDTKLLRMTFLSARLLAWLTMSSPTRTGGVTRSSSVKCLSFSCHCRSDSRRLLVERGMCAHDLEIKRPPLATMVNPYRLHIHKRHLEWPAEAR